MAVNKGMDAPVSTTLVESKPWQLGVNRQVNKASIEIIKSRGELYEKPI